MTERELIQTQCLTNTLFFTRLLFRYRFKRKYIVGRHHEIISKVLDQVYAGELTRVCIRVAPRYGKTELAVKNGIAKGLALNPEAKFIHLSYSNELALDNSSEIKDIIQEDVYQELFPYVQIRNDVKSKKKWYTTAGGGVYATSTAGQVTGFGAGIVDEEESVDEQELDSFIKEVERQCSMLDFGGAIVIDDPIKPEDALSDTKRNKINNRFYSTIYNRVNSRKTPIIIIGQATHEEDLIGYVMKQEPGVWELINIPCIYLDDEGKEYALYPPKHTLEELYDLREADKFVFETQYQQDPKPLEGLLLPISELNFADMNNIPIECIQFSFSVGDPADKGGDKYSMPFLQVVIYENKFQVYVRDVIHNKDGIEVNTNRIIDKIKENNTEKVLIEVNGVGLAAVINLKNNLTGHTEIAPFTSTEEKEVRILSNYEFIKKYFVFDINYKENKEYNSFISDLSSYLKEGENKHRKDAIDVLCSAAKALKAKYRTFLCK